MASHKHMYDKVDKRSNNFFSLHVKLYLNVIGSTVCMCESSGGPLRVSVHVQKKGCQPLMNHISQKQETTLFTD